MADRNMKRMFRDAADIARSVPAEFRQAAFDKAVDLLAQQGNGAANGSTDDRETRVHLTGLSAPDALIDRSVEALAYAANRLGLEVVTADQLAAILNERFGVPAPASLVAAALGSAGAVVRTVQRGSQTLYRVVSEPAVDDSSDPDEVDSTPHRRATDRPRPKTSAKPAAKAAPKAAPAKKGPAKKKPSAKISSNPADIINDLVALGFFATARTTTDVLLYLEKQGLQLTTRQIAPLLLSLMRSGLLNRGRANGGRYNYRSGFDS